MKKILLATAVIGAFTFGAKAAATDAWEFTLDYDLNKGAGALSIQDSIVYLTDTSRTTVYGYFTVSELNDGGAVLQYDPYTKYVRTTSLSHKSGKISVPTKTGTHYQNQSGVALDAKGDMSVSASIDDYTQPKEGSSKQNRIVYAASFSGDAPTYTTVMRMVDGKEMAFAENLLLVLADPTNGPDGFYKEFDVSVANAGGTTTKFVAYSPTNVPEPTSALLLLLGMSGLMLRRKYA